MRGIGFGRRLLASMIGLAAASVMASAQTTGSPYEPELQQLVLEGKVDVANIKPVEPEFAAFVASGPYELRVRLDNWNFRGRNYRVTIFVVAPGAPLPTPGPQLPDPTSATVVAQFVARVETIFHVKYADSGPGIAFGGRVIQRLGGFGELELGEVFMAGFAYPVEGINATAAVPATFRQVTVWSPNSFNAYVGDAPGSIQVAPPRN